MMAARSYLDVRGLCVLGDHGDRRAALSFSVHAGEVLCVLGTGGSGKSDLCRALMGLVPASATQVTLNGQPASLGELRNHAAYVPQIEPPSPPGTTVREFVLSSEGARLARSPSQPPRDEHSKALEALQRLGVAHLRDQPIAEVSRQEQRLIHMSRAVAQDPQLLVLDEPAAGLSFEYQARVFGAIARLQAAGAAVLLTSSEVERAMSVANVILLIGEDGAPLSTGRPAEVMQFICRADGHGIKV